MIIAIKWWLYMCTRITWVCSLWAANSSNQNTYQYLNVYYLFLRQGKAHLESLLCAPRSIRKTDKTCKMNIWWHPLRSPQGIGSFTIKVIDGIWLHSKYTYAWLLLTTTIMTSIYLNSQHDGRFISWFHTVLLYVARVIY